MIKKGFTLIELLVVISIIGILATLVAANLNSARSRARDAQRKSDVRNIATALRLYFNDKGYYPASDSSGNIKGCDPSASAVCDWGTEWSVNSGGTVYMAKLPSDPLSVQSYYYAIGPTGDTFTLSSCLENKSDSTAISLSSIGSWSCSTGTVFQVKQ